MNTIDILLILLIVAVCVIAIVSGIRNRIKGKGCCNDCGRCHSNTCHKDSIHR